MVLLKNIASLVPVSATVHAPLAESSISKVATMRSSSCSFYLRKQVKAKQQSNKQQKIWNVNRQQQYGGVAIYGSLSIILSKVSSILAK